MGNLILIQFLWLFSLNSRAGDDDFIFEEFARIRLKGHDPDDTDV